MTNKPQLQPFLGPASRQQERDDWAQRMEAEWRSHPDPTPRPSHYKAPTPK